MPRHNYDDVYDDEYEDEPRRRGDRSRSPPRARTRDIRQEEYRPCPSQRDTRSSTLSDTVSFSTAPSSALSISTAGQSSSSTAATARYDSTRHHRSSRTGHTHYTRDYLRDRSQRSVSETTVSRHDVVSPSTTATTSSQQRHWDAASSLTAASSSGFDTPSLPDTHANYTDALPVYRSPPRETSVERAVRLNKRVFGAENYSPTPSEYEAVQRGYSYRETQAGRQADWKLARRSARAAGYEEGPPYDEDDVVSETRHAQMRVRHDGTVVTRDHAPGARSQYTPPEGWVEGVDPEKGKFKRSSREDDREGRRTKGKGKGKEERRR